MKDVTRWDLNKVGEMLLAKIISSHCTQGDFFQQKGDFVPCMMLVVDGVSVNFLSDRILSVCHVLDQRSFGAPRDVANKQCTCL